MTETGGGRWAQIRERVLSTPELQEEYERGKRSLRLTRQLLMQIDSERERLGLTKADLARRMGTSPSVIRRIFSSGSSNPRLDTLLGMLEALGMEMELRPGGTSQLRAEPSEKRRAPEQKGVAT